MKKETLVEAGTIAPLADQASPDMYTELVNTGVSRLVRMVMPPVRPTRLTDTPKKSSISSAAGSFQSVLRPERLSRKKWQTGK